MVEVTQQDRDAASGRLQASCKWDVEAPDFLLSECIQMGHGDGEPLVQAFAQHRIATEAQTVAEIVAWLRERANDTSRFTVREMQSRGYRDAMSVINQTADAIEQRAYK